MNRTASVLALGLLASTTVHAQNATSPLIVVEDRGGISALPYYQALNPQDAGSPTPPAPASRIGNSADAEAAMLPVHSTRLSPGDEPRRVIRAPGLTPLFLVGDDDRSRAWLRQHQTKLRDLQAVGLVVNVVSVEALASLRRLAPGLVLSPASADDLAQRLGIRHYPVLITATGIEP
ncbi:TPA: integrating conjugative element protein [Burkholderia cenocepacia]|uniref:integrating conjugative element protein n=1 Tax=Burkholderia cenocepacia TaxID=95486 RepID=UPI002AB7A355|nr:integrating conjugative element protein [Burkholderia cenocepacia]